MVSGWWREPNTVFYNNKYEPAVAQAVALVEEAKLVGVFFGSYKNRSTKHFIKYLNKFYTYVKENNLKFEIIYVPLDEDEGDCTFFVQSVMAEWLVVPWDAQSLRRNVRNMYNVLDQPWLVVCKNDTKGHILSFNAKADLLDYGYLCIGEWELLAKNVDPLS